MNECNHQGKNKILISGKKIRNLILLGKKVPNKIMRKKISAMLSNNSII